MTYPLPHFECDNNHVDNLPAIVCLDSRLAPMADATPIQRCDTCWAAGIRIGNGTDEAAAAAVAAQTGRVVRVFEDAESLQFFVTPALGGELLMCSRDDAPPYGSLIRVIALRRDEGTILVFRGLDVETGDNVEFAADRRPGLVLIDELDAGARPRASVEPWQILMRWRVKGAHV